MSDDEINLAIERITGQRRDYCYDLNAMREAEMKRIFPFKYSLGMVYCAELTNRFRDTAPIAATARQRAEAFLRTLGKWKE